MHSARFEIVCKRFCLPPLNSLLIPYRRPTHPCSPCSVAFLPLTIPQLTPLQSLSYSIQTPDLLLLQSLSYSLLTPIQSHFYPLTIPQLTPLQSHFYPLTNVRLTPLQSISYSPTPSMSSLQAQYLTLTNVRLTPLQTCYLPRTTVRLTHLQTPYLFHTNLCRNRLQLNAYSVRTSRLSLFKPGNASPFNATQRFRLIRIESVTYSHTTVELTPHRKVGLDHLQPNIYPHTKVALIHNSIPHLRAYKGGVYLPSVRCTAKMRYSGHHFSRLTRAGSLHSHPERPAYLMRESRKVAFKLNGEWNGASPVLHGA